PADFATRSWASVIRVLSLPFTIVYAPRTIGIVSRPIVRLYELRTWCLTVFDGITPMVWCALMIALATVRLRYALALGLLVAFFAAYPMLQFDWRHVFHLEFVALWLDALAMWMLISRASEIRRRLTRRDSRRRMLYTAIALVLLIVAPVAVLRRYQTARVFELISDYMHEHRDDIALTTTMADDRFVRFDMDLSLTKDTPASVATEMLAIEVNGARGECIRPDLVELTVKYLQPDHSLSDAYSHRVRLENGRRPATSVVAFVPIYVFARDTGPRFVGIESRRDQRTCISRVSRLANTKHTRLLLEMAVPEPGSTLPLFERLGEESEIVPTYLRSTIRRIVWPRLNS
ncbi:MAG TPA: hypothetical protein VLV86_03690, partial [Vicinamibacterales bacterium]|nr:hypothetical protein [Vicinamibacterales bacterium]